MGMNSLTGNLEMVDTRRQRENKKTKRATRSGMQLAPSSNTPEKDVMESAGSKVSVCA